MSLIFMDEMFLPSLLRTQPVQGTGGQSVSQRNGLV